MLHDVGLVADDTGNELSALRQLDGLPDLPLVLVACIRGLDRIRARVNSPVEFKLEQLGTVVTGYDPVKVREGGGLSVHLLAPTPTTQITGPLALPP
jgi:hypothetical protein